MAGRPWRRQKLHRAGASLGTTTVRYRMSCPPNSSATRAPTSTRASRKRGLCRCEPTVRDTCLLWRALSCAAAALTAHARPRIRGARPTGSARTVCLSRATACAIATRVGARTRFREILLSTCGVASADNYGRTCRVKFLGGTRHGLYVG